ncbi:hypothetical protein ACJX0J_026960 [Zea mays]
MDGKIANALINAYSKSGDLAGACAEHYFLEFLQEADPRIQRLLEDSTIRIALVKQAQGQLAFREIDSIQASSMGSILFVATEVYVIPENHIEQANNLEGYSFLAKEIAMVEFFFSKGVRSDCLGILDVMLLHIYIVLQGLKLFILNYH